MNTLLDEGLQAGLLNYWLSSFTSGLSDGFIDTALERFASVPSELSAIFIEHFHGAVTRIGVTDAAVPHREEGWNCLIPGVWEDPAETAENIAWTKDTYAALSEHFAGTPLAQLPRRRSGRRRDPRRLRAELRPARRGEAEVRPRQRLPPQPQHQAVAARQREEARAARPRPGAAGGRCGTTRRRACRPRRRARARGLPPRAGGTPRQRAGPRPP